MGNLICNYFARTNLHGHMYKLFERQNESKDDNQSDEISFAITRQNICEIFLGSGTKRKLLTLRLKKGMFVISM